ncbi:MULTISPECIES: homoserine kinase [Thermomonospora]|uniref:Homoserine kinase n=1 Tax=Thermomonospora curvata (strain ATCC 19995 / DSM 43183 / JCM 3096 / KCTC 9072 / NBRC 15933 / NCIMB 10081 / Henssen B9) TaxID=471852 RepID=D1AE39_THECD|nr:MULTISPECIES: homoserine kinase [Thermomonospora]ACY99465.1 homoserine kinase [Thermomonospora curvata DSM 43183]PKK12506.1 MAG: homoserine kinase [Thermomonospora sp. CIF 1]
MAGVNADRSRQWIPRVRVRVPATSANLGPGFDSLGLALALYDDVTVEITEGGLSIAVDGEGAEVADRGERHLIVKVLRRTFDLLEELSGAGLGQPPGLRLSCVNRIPHSRGLGSSSAAIIAGIVAARALHPCGRLLDDAAALTLATEIEGHPDNVAPCLYGGLTIAWSEPDGPRALRLDLDRQVVVFVPDHTLPTERARGLLPQTVPHEDAAVNAGRAALLIAALTGGLGEDVMLAATEDRLHQEYRAPAMPESADLVARLRAAGVPAVISGAGPTVLAFTTASRVDSIGPKVGNGWHKHSLNVDPHGAYVQPPGP